MPSLLKFYRRSIAHPLYHYYTHISSSRLQSNSRRRRYGLRCRRSNHGNPFYSAGELRTITEDPYYTTLSLNGSSIDCLYIPAEAPKSDCTDEISCPSINTFSDTLSTEINRGNEKDNTHHSPLADLPTTPISYLTDEASFTENVPQIEIPSSNPRPHHNLSILPTHYVSCETPRSPSEIQLTTLLNTHRIPSDIRARSSRDLLNDFFDEHAFVARETRLFRNETRPPKHSWCCFAGGEKKERKGSGWWNKLFRRLRKPRSIGL